MTLGRKPRALPLARSDQRSPADLVGLSPQLCQAEALVLRRRWYRYPRRSGDCLSLVFLPAPSALQPLSSCSRTWFGISCSASTATATCLPGSQCVFLLVETL